MGIVIPVLPTLIEQFTGSNARAGIINGVFVALWALMQFLASTVIGSLSDQHGRRPVILVSTAGLAIDYVLMALAADLWWLALGRIIAGEIGRAHVCTPVTNAQLVCRLLLEKNNTTTT